MLKVAALQFATGIDVEQNLQTCLRMIDSAAVHKPGLMVLPEFCNRLSWYSSKAEAYECAVELNGPFLSQIAERAKQHQTHIVINCTIKRPQNRITITSILFDDAGQPIAVVDKQTLMGRENDFFDRADSLGPVAGTPFGKVGLYACRDGVTMEAPRSLAIRGAQILCVSLNSFAFDEAGLHIPVRAPENKVFVISANKVGPLIPLNEIESAAQKLGIAASFLYGAGESQIVAPDGVVLAKGPRSGEAIVAAEIDISLANDKCRPNKIDIFKTRRPHLYRSIAEKPNPDTTRPPAAEVINVAVYQPQQDGPAAVPEVTPAIAEAIMADVSLLVLPELFCFKAGEIDDLATAATQSEAAILAIQSACQNSDLAVCTSLIQIDKGQYYHNGVLLTAEGIIFSQPQLHQSQLKHITLGDEIKFIDLPWGRFGILVGDDSIYPETAKVLAIKGADVLAVPCDVKEPWEAQLGLPDRSAENRVCLVSASRPKPFGASLIIDQWQDFTIFTPWKSRTFDGTINQPIITTAPSAPGLTVAQIHPQTARMKLMSSKTDLILGRPWFLAQTLTS